MDYSNYQSANNRKFSEFVTDPAQVQPGDERDLALLLEKYPYAQILHMLQARCAKDNPAKFEEYLSKAALYAPDRSILYRVVNDSDFFHSTKGENPPTNPVSESLSAPESASSYPASAEEILEELAAIDIPEDEPVLLEAVPLNVENTPAENSETGALEIEPEELPGNDEPLQVEAEEIEPETAEIIPETHKTDETQKLIIGNIAATDYFRFERNLDDQKTLTSPVDVEPPGESVEAKASQEVSKYNDENLPYTFLWWLNRTRKEHADTYQPFKPETTQVVKKNSGDELNHQIIENIFHLQAPLEPVGKEQPKGIPYNLKRKEEEIIEKFIKEEPQIKPPKAEKLDTENKARRSSEDSNDVVSETLAQIYIEQMLFDKAIETYRKLSLKFPEKSAYFAHQIRKLENR